MYSAIIMPVKNKYAELIASGIKTVEYRRRAPKTKHCLWFVYVSAPIKKVMGCVTIKDIVQDNVGALWNSYKMPGEVAKEEFEAYFSGVTIGYGLLLENFTSFRCPVRPGDVFNGFVVPQSFKYLNELETTLLLSAGGVEGVNPHPMPSNP